jgi:SAM-dependent methyltransferase
VQPADVPSEHDFFDPDYVRRWAEEVTGKNPQRPTFFDAFVRAIGAVRREVVVLELGSGPGFLAEQILNRCRVTDYYLLDSSPEMHELSRKRLARDAARTVFVEADFRDPQWPDLVPTAVDVAVSLQALHELRHVGRAPGLYRQLRSVLRPHGVVLVCDHLRSSGDERPLFMSVHEHLAALSAGGLRSPKLVLDADGMAMFLATNPAPSTSPGPRHR